MAVVIAVSEDAVGGKDTDQAAAAISADEMAIVIAVSEDTASGRVADWGLVDCIAKCLGDRSGSF